MASPSLRQAWSAARLWAAGRYPYLSAALFAVQPVEGTGPAMHAIDRRGRVFLHPQAVATWSTAQLGTGLIHQVEHLLRDHHTRGESLIEAGDGLLWQVSVDAEINDDLIKAGLQVPPGSITPASLGCPDDLFAEEYVERLGLGGKKVAATKVLSRDPFPSCGTFLPEVTTVAVPEAPHGLDPAELRALLHQVELAVIDGQGEGTAGLARSGQSRVAGGPDWRRILARFVRMSAATASGYADYTYSRPARRRSVGPDIVFPGFRQPKPVIAVVVDTSGSVSARALGSVLAQIRGLVSGVGGWLGQMWVVSCDAEVHSATVVRRAVEVDTVDLRGGGGTDLRVGLAAAQKLWPAPEVTVVLTDGKTPWPQWRPRGHTVIGLLDVKQRPPGLPAWATVVEIDTEYCK